MRATTESEQVEELKKQLAESERMRGVLEMNRSIFNSGKDEQIDRLRQELSDAKEDRTKKENDQIALLKKLDAENEEMREEFTTRMREKNAKITALEQTLAAQEQVVGTMSNEMDQLQNGMEKISIQRRAEIEEMQQELMDYTAKSTKLEREVIALTMKLDESKFKHKAKVEKLKEKISELESESPMERITRPDRDDGHHRESSKLKEKAEHLKWLNTSLKEENEKLKGKLEAAEVAMARAEEELQTKTSKNNDKWRTVALQDQVAMLSKRVVELEEEAEAKKKVPSRSNSQTGSPVLRSSLRNGSSTARQSSPIPRAPPRVVLDDQMYPDSNHDLLSHQEEDDEKNIEAASAVPPRPSPSEKDKAKSKSRFFGKKSSKGVVSPRDDGSQSTSNYDF
jgi:myosin heavy subunit